MSSLIRVQGAVVAFMSRCSFLVPCVTLAALGACSAELAKRNTQTGSSVIPAVTGTVTPVPGGTATQSGTKIASQSGQCVPSLVESDTRLAFVTQPATVWEYKNRTGDNQLPDFVIRAFKRDNETCLLIPHHELGLICGSSLTSLGTVAQKVYESPSDPLFPNYNYHNWIVSPYTLSDGSLFALAHSEWYECLRFSADPTRSCNVGSNQLNSWSNAISGFSSKDGGRSWAKNTTIQRPEALSDVFPSLWTQSLLHFGFFHPGNIIQEKNFFYAFATHVGRNMSSGAVTDSGLILLRTADLRSSTWQQVVPGSSPVTKPYEAMILPGTTNNHAHLDFATVTYNTSLCKYLLTFWDNSTTKLRYTTFDSLENPVFGTIRDVSNQEALTIPFNKSATGLVPHNYPTGQLDPDSSGKNFEYTDSEFYMFLSSFNPTNGLNRNVLRTKLKLVGANAVPGIRIDEQENEFATVYRFSNGSDHLYSRNSTEGLGSVWSSEGAAFRLFSQNADGRQALFRCVNSFISDHFLSTDAACDGSGPSEGVLGYLSTSQVSGGATLIRCYAKASLLHLSTINAAECPSATTTTEGIQGYTP